MKVIKRDGRIVTFDRNKIVDAVLKAFKNVDSEITQYAKDKARDIASYIENMESNCDSEITMSVEEIQDIVETKLMACQRKDVAKEYILYRNERTRRRGSITDETVLDFLGGTSDYWNNENSNKDAKVVTTQRDYLAGISSTDIARRFLLPKEVCDAHDAGIIHQHDMDYMAQNALNNCGLINLEDCLQNGTVINGVKIDPQNRLLTATTVATQIITAVASSQYGGCTITLTDLAPYVRKSYKKYVGKYMDRNLTMNDCIKFAKEDLHREISDAVQTFNYQINSMSTTNGQSPFLSVCMYLGETDEYKEELAMLIEEFLNQRILGMKNEKGVYVTPAFPKLLYVLEEDNINEDSKYWYLTQLAAKCTAKRLVPDYISEKVMKELKNNPVLNIGEAYPCINKICA